MSHRLLRLLLATTATLLAAVEAPAAEPAPALALVVRDATALRAEPRESSRQQAVLWPGEVVQVRGEKLDHLQVWDDRLERGGFVEASRVRRLTTSPGEAAELMAVVRFLRETPGAEAMGIGFAAAWLRAASPEALRGAAGAEAFDAIGTMADRLAVRASAGMAVAALPAGATGRSDTALAAHLEVVARYGVVLRSIEKDDVVRLCYDGEAFRRVLALAATPAQQARAALGLTRDDCLDPRATLLEREHVDAWRAQVLDRVDSAALAPTLKHRIALRRAGVWSGLAYRQARKGDAKAAGAAAARALSELAAVDRAELADADLAAWNDSAIRVGASRLAAAPAPARPPRAVGVVTEAQEDGQTCVLLVDDRHGASAPLARRCTWGLVWTASATLDREGNALALAVQPMEAWRELWIFHRQSAGGWDVQVLPPATATGFGYAEFAGWVPGGRQLLVARESRAEGRYRRSFEVVSLATLVTERQSTEPSVLGPFLRWQDAGWKRETVSLR